VEDGDARRWVALVLTEVDFDWKQSFTGRFREYLLTMFAFHGSNRRSVQFCILFERKIEV
jgi:hypothetical protein